MVSDRLTGSFTWYKTNTFNQFITVQPSFTVGKQQGYVNAGNIQNTGIEFMLGYDVLKNRHFTWNTSVNGSANVNKIIDVDSKDNLTQIILTGSANNSYQSILNVGDKYGDIWGTNISTNKQGQVLLSKNSTGLYAPSATGLEDLGNPNPTFQLGWANSFTIHRFTLNFLLDGKFGGKVLSMTQAMLDSYGVSNTTGAARQAGGVKVNGVDATSGEAVTTVDPQTWYTTIGGRAGIAGAYMYSATVIRLREADLGYNFPMKTGSPVKSLRLSLTGRNLIYFLKHAPYDPEQTMSTGNGLSGVDTFTQPAQRNFGLSLNVGL
jgi:hypothetical protein